MGTCIGKNNFLTRLKRLWPGAALGVDLGTANIRIYSPKRGLLSKKRAVGDAVEAASYGRNILTGDFPYGLSASLRSLGDRISGDPDATAVQLRKCIRRLCKPGWSRPDVVVGAPSNANSADIEILLTTLRRAGTSSVVLVPEPLAAAVGAGVDIASPYAQMLVDIGESITDMAVIRSGRLIATKTLTTACRSFRDAVRGCRMGLCHEEVEHLLWESGSTGGVTADSGDVTTVLEPLFLSIAEAVKRTLRHLPDKAACEVIESGICLTGGGAFLRGMAEFLADQTSLAVNVAGDPLHAVIHGLGRMLEGGGSPV
ncbi:MAG: hypothetical protein GXX84_04230 [Acidobacteria bacterium]|nr:hypothetical protein [Acidobacteriota bacterium]